MYQPDRRHQWEQPNAEPELIAKNAPSVHPPNTMLHINTCPCALLVLRFLLLVLRFLLLVLRFLLRRQLFGLLAFLAALACVRQQHLGDAQVA